MSIVRHGASPFWYYRFIRGGKTYFGSTKEKNEAKARKVEAEKIAEVESGRRDIPEIELREALDMYLDAMPNQGQRKNITTKVTKLCGYKTCIKTGDTLNVFGFDSTMPFHQLRTQDVQRLVMERRREGNANATILYELGVISQTIKLMRKLGYQVPEIDIRAIKSDNKVRPDKHKVRFLTLAEERALLEQLHPDTAVRGVNGVEETVAQRQDAYDFVVTLLDTGARHSEITGLTWKNVDLANGQIHLYRPKVRNESVLPISNRLLAVLKRRHEAKRQDQKYVFESSAGVPRNNCPKALSNAAKRADVEAVTFHTLRHTFASRLAQAGMSLHEIGQLLGHSNPATTAIYAHLLPSVAGNKAVDILNQLSKGN